MTFGVVAFVGPDDMKVVRLAPDTSIAERAQGYGTLGQLIRRLRDLIVVLGRLFIECRHPGWRDV